MYLLQSLIYTFEQIQETQIKTLYLEERNQLLCWGSALQLQTFCVLGNGNIEISNHFGGGLILKISIDSPLYVLIKHT